MFILKHIYTNFYIFQDVIASLTDSDVEEYGDIHFDIAETMVECGYHEEAKPILQSLVQSEQYSKVYQ